VKGMRKICVKTVIRRDSAVFGRESRGGVTQSPREAHTKPTPTCLGYVVAVEGSAMFTRPAQRLLSLIFPVVVARGAAQISSRVVGGVLILLVQNNT